MAARRRSSRQAPRGKDKAKAEASVGGDSPPSAACEFSFSRPGAGASPPAAPAGGQFPKFSFGGAAAAAPVGAAKPGGAVFQFGASKFILLTDDLVLRVMKDAGPRWSSLLGATCKRLHAVSTLDELWKVFWMRRAAPSFFPPAGAIGQFESDETREGKTGDDPSHTSSAPTAEPARFVQPAQPVQWLETPVPETGIAAAYARLHVKPRPLPQGAIRHRDRAGIVTVIMRNIWCNKRYGRRSRHREREWECCGDDATVWCDWPQCSEARCKRHECQNEDEYSQEDRDWKPMNTQTFASCSWCSLQVCPAHAAVCGWRRCDLCEKSSCPDCAGELHVAPTGICEFYTARKFEMFPQRCARFVCQQCARIVSKASEFKVRVEPVPPDALAATNERDKAYWHGPDCRRFPVVCCAPCSNEAAHRMMEARMKEIERRQEAAATMAAIAPCPAAAVPDRCPFAFAIGSFRTVDSEGRAGVLHFGTNQAGHLGGWWQFRPTADATAEPDSASQCEPEDESALEEEQDFVGLGPAWERGRENASYCQPRTTLNAGGEEGKHRVELYAVAAPDYCFQFRRGRNLGTPGTMYLTRVEMQDKVLLKGELQVDDHRIYFTGAPLGEVPLESDCTHDAAAIEAAEAAAVAARMAVKRGRRERMEALAAKYPAWGEQMQYEKGESSDSEIDTLDESDIVPPWLREHPAQAQPSNEPATEDY